MFVAKVIGNIVATKKDQRIVGWKLLLVSDVDINGHSNGKFTVAVDIVGAGIGEVVLVVEGSSARKAINDAESPIDAAIVGIIDNMEVDVQ